MNAPRMHRPTCHSSRYCGLYTPQHLGSLSYDSPRRMSACQPRTAPVRAAGPVSRYGRYPFMSASRIRRFARNERLRQQMSPCLRSINTGTTLDGERQSSRTLGTCGPESRPSTSAILLSKFRARENGISEFHMKVDPRKNHSGPFEMDPGAGGALTRWGRERSAGGRSRHEPAGSLGDAGEVG